MAERDSVHQDCNDHVNSYEQNKLRELDELIHSKTLAPHMQEKIESAFDEEINRLYVEGEDHELMRDWINGENVDIDDDYPLR